MSSPSMKQQQHTSDWRARSTWARLLFKFLRIRTSLSRSLWCAPRELKKQVYYSRCILSYQTQKTLNYLIFPSVYCAVPYRVLLPLWERQLGLDAQPIIQSGLCRPHVSVPLVVFTDQVSPVQVTERLQMFTKDEAHPQFVVLRDGGSG